MLCGNITKLSSIMPMGVCGVAGGIYPDHDGSGEVRGGPLRFEPMDEDKGIELSALNLALFAFPICSMIAACCFTRPSDHTGSIVSPCAHRNCCRSSSIGS